MSKWYTWGIVLGLLLGYSKASASIQPSPAQKKPKNSSKKSSKRIKVTLPAKKTPEQEEAEKQQLIAEEMRMQYAWMYSAILPGLGQACNAQYWKIPIFYVISAGLGWGAIYNHDEYVSAKRVMIGKNRFDYREIAEVNAYRKNRDVFLIFSALWYLANVFDAYVSASLKTFDISSDIGPKFKPSVTPPTTQNAPAIGISLTWNLLHDYRSER